MNSGGTVLGAGLVILMAVAPFVTILDKNAWSRRDKYLWFSAIVSLVISVYLIGIRLSLDGWLAALALGCIVIPILMGLQVWTTWKLLNIAHSFRERASWRNDDDS